MGKYSNRGQEFNNNNFFFRLLSCHSCCHCIVAFHGHNAMKLDKKGHEYALQMA